MLRTGLLATVVALVLFAPCLDSRASSLVPLPARQDPPGPLTSDFVDLDLGLTFVHPKTWKIEKKLKDRTILSMPIEGTTERASLEIMRSGYRADPDLWQTIQLRANEQLHRQVVRQWQQEILGVPMLLTQVSFSEKDEAKTALVGLLYTRTPLKFNFRLTSPAGDFEKVQYAFNSALESLRTVDNSLPKVEDPNRPPDPAPDPKKKKKVEDDPVIDLTPRVRKTLDPLPPAKTITPPTTVEITVSTRKMLLRIPAGWTADQVQGNALVLKHADVANPIPVTVFSTLDSDPAKTALFKASSESLGAFTKVDFRDDYGPTNNKAGCEISAVWRSGTGDSGELHTLEAYGQTADWYFLLVYRPSGGSAFKTERKVIEALLGQITIVPAPASGSERRQP